MFKRLIWTGKGCLTLLLLLGVRNFVFAQGNLFVSSQSGDQFRNCDESRLCLDRVPPTSYEGKYVGHDEPALLFYSNVPGSGSMSVYTLVLPKDPPIAPRQDGTGGTFNFQLHPAFWFGMALCDTQSAPNADRNGTCIPSTDANIFDNPDPNSADYIGKHPGAAFMELQFYPPGWIASPVLISPDAYFAALTIASVSINFTTKQLNNIACLQSVGIEPQNFAIVTRNGIPLFHANPLGTPFGKSRFDLKNVLQMSPGDTLRITIRDSEHGLRVQIEDLTSGDSGFMIAGPAAGFGQVDFDPTATTCSITPYEFHPMYSTSSEHTRVPWAAHSYNISFSDEIGHFEYCNAIGAFGCSQAGAGETTLDADDIFCLSPTLFGIPTPPFQPITGCIESDGDFDGPAYGNNWPGTNPATDASLHPSPIRFTSPIFEGRNGLENYDRVAFEADLPAIEGATCDTRTGARCVNPPPGAAFYPIFSTTEVGDGCMWQFGGANIPGTVNNFGGNSVSEYSELVAFPYPTRTLGVIFLTENFRRILDRNPCPTTTDGRDEPAASSTAADTGSERSGVLKIWLTLKSKYQEVV